MNVPQWPTASGPGSSPDIDTDTGTASVVEASPFGLHAHPCPPMLRPKRAQSVSTWKRTTAASLKQNCQLVDIACQARERAGHWMLNVGYGCRFGLTGGGAGSGIPCFRRLNNWRSNQQKPIFRNRKQQQLHGR
ncbi:uncharacterized protein LOC115563926 [Drosophila navojoa]|uniref:uncharacterized protein LOC115563926 n=1 Tax=Drosophila navojoa TaxID=7232 RepID=UPI0011BE0C31|nr:uncharacterized protein LOC115563926 [Drosophila navojoa]